MTELIEKQQNFVLVKGNKTVIYEFGACLSESLWELILIVNLIELRNAWENIKVYFRVCLWWASGTRDDMIGKSSDLMNGAGSLMDS